MFSRSSLFSKIEEVTSELQISIEHEHLIVLVSNVTRLLPSVLARNCKPSGARCKCVLVNALYGLGQLLLSLVAL